MADTPNDPVVPVTKAARPAAAPTPVPTPDFRATEQAFFDRKLAADDAARDKAEKVTLVAIASFTLMVDDPQFPDGKLVTAGDDFEISTFDLPRFNGRGRLKSLDDPNKAGVTSIRE